jgi:hypothetical protein
MFRATYLISDFLHSLSSVTGISGGIIGLAIGLLLLFFGYKLKRVALALAGIVLGLAGGFLLVDRFFMDNAVLSIVLPIAGALAGAVLSAAVYKLALYLLGFAAGGAAGLYLSMNFIANPIWGIVIAVVLALILGSVAIYAEKPIVILAASFLGYMLFRLGLYLLLRVEESLVIEIVSLVLLVACILFQFLTNRKKEEEKYRSGEDYEEARR